MKEFRNTKKERAMQVAKIRECLLLLEDALGNIDIINYIKNSVETLAADDIAKISIDSRSLTIQTSSVDFSIEVDGTFSSFSTIKTTDTDKSPQTLGHNTTKKRLTVRGSFKESSILFIRELKMDGITIIKKRNEHRIYMGEDLVFRRGQKHEHIINRSAYNYSGATYDYFISGEESIKRQNVFEFAGHFQGSDSIDDISNNEIQYFSLAPVATRYFDMPLCLLEPSGVDITSDEFKRKLKRFRNKLAKDDAPKELLKQME